MAFRVKKLALLAAAASLFATAEAQGVEPSSLRADPFSALVGRRKPAAERVAAQAMVERFVIATDDRVFLFQSSGGEGRLNAPPGQTSPAQSTSSDL